MKTTRFENKKKSKLLDALALGGLAYGASKLMGGGKPDLVGDTAPGGALAPDKVAMRNREADILEGKVGMTGISSMNGSPAVAPEAPRVKPVQARPKLAPSPLSVSAADTDARFMRSAPAAPITAPSFTPAIPAAPAVVNPGGLQNGYGQTQDPSGNARQPINALPLTRTEAFRNAKRQQYDPANYDARDLRLQQMGSGMADGGCVAPRSSRSFPKKGG